MYKICITLGEGTFCNISTYTCCTSIELLRNNEFFFLINKIFI